MTRILYTASNVTPYVVSSRNQLFCFINGSNLGADLRKPAGLLVLATVIHLVFCGHELRSPNACKSSWLLSFILFSGLKTFFP